MNVCEFLTTSVKHMRLRVGYAASHVFRVLEQIAAERAVVELALLVRRAAERALKLRVRAQEVEPPVLGPGIGRAEGGVERLGLALFHQALAVGRVRDDDAAVGRAVKFPRVRHREGDAVVHAGAAGIVARHGDGAGVHVGGEDVVVAVKLACARFLARLRPDLGRQPRPLHGRKVAADARRAAFGGQRRLDGNGAAAAKRVYKDVIFDTSPVVGKVYKNSENRRKQGVSCGFRCIVRCSIDLVRAQPRYAWCWRPGSSAAVSGNN